MSEENRKRQAAMRLFGALSGVDEEYLAGCEADAGEKGGAGKSIAFAGPGRFVRRYGAAAAAVLCVAVLGGSILGYRISNRITGGSTAKQDASFEMALQEDAAENAEEIREGVEEFSTDEGKPDPEAGSTASVTSDSVESDPALGDLKGAITSGAREEALQGNRMEIPGLPGTDGEEFMTPEQIQELDVVGGYFPSALPRQGEISVLCGRDLPGQEKFTLGWNLDQESPSGWFYVSAENLGDTLPDGIEERIADTAQPEAVATEGAVFREGDFAKKSVEACLIQDWGNADGRKLYGGNFGVLYEEAGNYVLVTFYGEGTVEEVWELMNSVSSK